MAKNSFDSSFEGIIEAFNIVRIEGGFARRHYPSSYEGIVSAVRDLGKDLSGANPTPYPPGWKPEFDGDGNEIGGDFEPGFTPAQGDLWFDTRQGRLLVYVDDAYYQTNGADVLTAVQDDAPDAEIEGALWYQPNSDSLYLWTGTEWRLVSSNTVNTASLMLANPTTADSTRLLPSTDGLSTQSDFNVWAVSALESLDQNAGSGNTTVYLSENPPTDSEVGDLWFNTVLLQMFVEYDGYWIPTSYPLVQDPNFIALSSDVSSLQESVQNRFTVNESRIESLENEEHKSYSLELDNVCGIALVDEDGAKTCVGFRSQGGLTVSSSNGTITFDSSNLLTKVSDIEIDYLKASDKSALAAADSDLQDQITALATAPKVSTTAFAELQAVVAALPGVSYVDTKLPLAGGALTGSLSLSNYTITDVGAPQYQTDAARLADLTSLKAEVAATYVPKSNAVFNGLDVQRDDIALSGLKFVNGAAGGKRAIELKTNNLTNSTAVFGQTDYPSEVAWTFNSGENFSWIDGSAGKQLRIDKDGVIAKNLSIAGFVRSGDGDELILNKIDVKERITAYTTAFNGIRSALNSSTDFETFKAQALTALIGV